MNAIQSVKCAQLDLLIELKRLCEKYEINYFLIGGTLIGAIRHDGFIPWDDDIDVGMLRSDYEKFRVVCAKDLCSEYKLYNWENDNKSPLPFLKLKITGTHYREELAENTDMNDEIFIDIFPFDNAPDSLFLQTLQASSIYLIRKILLLKCGFSIDRGNRIKKLLYSILKTISSIASVPFWKKCCTSIMNAYNNRETSEVVNMCGAYSYKKELKKKELLTKTVPHLFEKQFFSVPEQYDTYLREIYGDYMELPPQDERIGRHGVSFVDLGKYKIKCQEIGVN